MEADRALTPVGFAWAFHFAMARLWPGISPAETTAYLGDMLFEPVGTPGYDWSVRGAQELARAYISEHGEG